MLQLELCRPSLMDGLGKSPLMNKIGYKISFLMKVKESSISTLIIDRIPDIDGPNYIIIIVQFRLAMGVGMSVTCDAKQAKPIAITFNDMFSIHQFFGTITISK